MTLKVMKWEMDGDDGQTRSGNWIAAVSPKSDVAEPVAQQQAAPVSNNIDEDSIPF